MATVTVIPPGEARPPTVPLPPNFPTLDDLERLTIAQRLAAFAAARLPAAHSQEVHS